MNAMTRTGLTLTLATLALAPAASAQIPGMPLFTNPRYGTGVRVFADYGQATEATVADRVIEAGASLALGPIGASLTVGTLKDNLESTQTCIQNPSFNCSDTHLSAAALAQLRIMGGGRSNVSLSLFAGAATDLNATDAFDCTTLPVGQQPICQAISDQYSVKELTIPLGAALGVRIPLGIASLNLWGAPRYSMTKFVGCQTGNTVCDGNTGKFRWAVGADFPILKIMSIRAAFDSGKVGNTTVSFWGIGASIGIGGVR
jgi:hypothetical protein